MVTAARCCVTRVEDKRKNGKGKYQQQPHRHRHTGEGRAELREARGSRVAAKGTKVRVGDVAVFGNMCTSLTRPTGT